VGDLYFNGVASDVDRALRSAGVQGDFSYAATAAQTARCGFTLLGESVTADSTTTVFPVDSGGNPAGPAFPIPYDEALHGLFAGAYLQDEWRIVRGLTLNFGARLDRFDSSFDDEGQLSPRINAIYRASDSTTLHAGYARYFTPPPVENVPGATVAEFSATSNQSATTQDDPVRAERSDYRDSRVSDENLRPALRAVQHSHDFYCMCLHLVDHDERKRGQDKLAGAVHSALAATIGEMIK